MWQQDTKGKADGAPAASGRTVLVVEDETLVRMLVVQMLEDAGHTVVECAEGRAALEALQSDMAIDIMVTDVGLPGVSGRQLAEQAQTRRPDLKILFMTGYADDAIDGLVAEGSELIAKPFALEELAAKISRMLTVRV
jgi:CheY-like chemotaxis protein